MRILTVYQSKAKKNIYVFSSLYISVELGESEKRKPKTKEFYNKTKCGVNVADQKARQYLIKVGTRRWSVALFYNFLDLVGITAFVFYTGWAINNAPKHIKQFR